MSSYGAEEGADRNLYNVMLVAAVIIVAVSVTYFFKFTKLGKYTRGIGANERTTAQCGVNTTKWKVIAYMAFGVCVAIGSFIMLTRTGSAGKGTGSGYAMDIMICLIYQYVDRNGENQEETGRDLPNTKSGSVVPYQCIAWSTLSKNPLMSNSTTYCIWDSCICLQAAAIACSQLRFGRNP